MLFIDKGCAYMEFNRLIPELTVSNLEASKHFYMDLCGFQLEYERKTEKFVFLSLEGSQIMLEEIHTGGWNVGKLHYPFGRGVNFSMEIDDIDAQYQRFVFHRYPLYRTLTINQYQSNGESIQQKEFLVQDPDGYLLRFTQEL